MTLALALTVGALFALGTFLVLRDDVVEVVLGLAVIVQAANVYLISMGGIEAGTSDTVPVLATYDGPYPETADPLVQALVLTAIVISFGMTAFLLALAYRTYQENETLSVRRWER